MMNNCLNCNEITTSNFCANCGHPSKIKRINKAYALQEFLNLLGYENGFIYTSKELMLRPGKTVQQYININRTKISRPITFLILSSFIYTIISQYFSIDIVTTKEMKSFYGDSTYYKIMIWINNNYGYANLLMLLPITFWTKIMFKKYNNNFYETFIILCLYMAEAMLFLAFSIVINKYLGFPKLIYDSVISFFMFIYISWTLGQFYGKNIKNYFKAFIAYVLGFITFQIITIIIATIYDTTYK